MLLEMTGQETTETTLEHATPGVLRAKNGHWRGQRVKRPRTLTRPTVVELTTKQRIIVQSIGLEPAHLDEEWRMEMQAIRNVDDVTISR